MSNQLKRVLYYEELTPIGKRIFNYRLRSRKTVNRQLLRQAASKLSHLRYEENYNQSIWMATGNCGTIACIGGHICLLAGATPADIDYLVATGMIKYMLAGLTGLPHFVALALFGGSSDRWPSPYRERFREARTDFWVNKFLVKPARYRGERPSRVAADFLEALASGALNLADFE